MRDAIISSNTEPYSSSSASASNVSYYKKSLKNLSVDQQIRAAEQKIKNDPLKPRRIHIFIGIKKYSALNDSDLTYSAKDASDFYSCNYYNEDDDIIFLLTDEKATLRNIKEVQKWTEENSNNKENDIMFFFSGHGYEYEAESKVESERHAYLIPHDGNIDKPNTLISMEYLISSIKKIKGRKKVILDACYSGRFIGKTTVTMDELVKTPVAKGVKGLSVAELKKMLGDARDIFWLNASRGDQIARELKEEENGILTACLKRALKYGIKIGEADLNGNKDITEAELASYAIYAVPCVTYKSMIIKEQLGTLEEIYEYFLKPAIKKLKRKTDISEKTREQLEYYDKIIAGNANKRFVMKTALNIVFESGYHYNDIYNRYVEPLIRMAKKMAQENGITIQTPTYIDSYKVSDDYQKDLVIKVAPVIDGKPIDQFELQRSLDEIAEEAYKEQLKHGGSEIGMPEQGIELERSGADIHKEFEVFKKKIITFYIKEGIGKKDKPKPADYNQDGQVTKEEVARYVISKATTMLDKWIVKKLAEKKGKAYEKYSDEEKEKARVEAAKFDIDSKIDPDEVIIILFELTHD